MVGTAYHRGRVARHQPGYRRADAAAPGQHRARAAPATTRAPAARNGPCPVTGLSLPPPGPWARYQDRTAWRWSRPGQTGTAAPDQRRARAQPPGWQGAQGRPCRIPYSPVQRRHAATGIGHVRHPPRAPRAAWGPYRGRNRPEVLTMCLLGPTRA